MLAARNIGETMPKKYVVTGGGGFLGAGLVEALLGQGHSVVSMARGDYPHLRDLGAQTVRADIAVHPESSRAQSVQSLNWSQYFEGADAVFHVAAKVDMWGVYDDFFRANVIGTRHILDACRRHGVPKLIYTSSPSVVADGTNLCGVDESYPIPRSHAAFYPATKAQAEQEVLSANGRGIWTVALRPHLIFGPGDNHFVPAILERARAGRLVQVGAGTNRTDLTFIEDCVSAHLCALHALESNPSCRGKPYFISQGEPVLMWEWINEVLRLNGVAELKRRVPGSLASILAGILETASILLPGRREPLFTRFLIAQMTTDHYFNISAAERDLAFRPRYSMAEAMRLTFGSESFKCPPAAMSLLQAR